MLHKPVVAAIVLSLVIPLALFAQDLRPPAGTLSLTTARIAQLATPATVTIVTLGASGDTLAQGSGFVVRRDGVIVTNWHVLVGASNAIVVTNNGERYDRVRFIDGDSGVDIALLKVPGSDLPVLPTHSQIPAPGERVVVIGSPLGLTRTVTDGIVSATRVVSGRQVVQVTAAISPGSSGGPVIDASGRAFAISTFYLQGGQQLNFAVPVRYALGFLLSPIRERAIADVFGGAASAGAASPAAPSVPAPARARQRRASMQGTFYFTRTSSRASGLGVYVADGLMVCAEARIGLAVESATDASTRARRDVVPVHELRTNADGQVVLDYLGQVFDGYQTDDGFFVRAHAEGAEHTILARRQSLPLSATSGVYHVQMRTDTRISGDTVIAFSLDWAGTAAVVTAADSMVVWMELYNSTEGTIGIWLEGEVSSIGNFHLRGNLTDETVSMDGAIRAGRFSGQWRRQLRGGSLSGHIEGVRD